jgi:hypothetical protein
MDLNKRTQQAIEDTGKIVGVQLNADQRTALKKVIEGVVVEAMREAAASSSRVAQKCCSHDLDMAHKVAQGVEQAHTALIANLSSLR